MCQIHSWCSKIFIEIMIKYIKECSSNQEELGNVYWRLLEITQFWISWSRSWPWDCVDVFNCKVLTLLKQLISLNWRMGEGKVVHSHNCILLGYQKQGHPEFCRNMDWTREYHPEWSNPGPKGHAWYIFTYKMLLAIKYRTVMLHEVTLFIVVKTCF